jgi:hypothetical protein
MAQDIFLAISGIATVNNGSIIVNPGGPRFSGCGAIDSETSYLDEHVPAMSSISGKYDSRFDDPTYYKQV